MLFYSRRGIGSPLPKVGGRRLRRPSPVRACGPPTDLCGGSPPSTPPGVTAGPLPHFPRGLRGRVGTDSFPKRHLWAAFGGPSRRGRFAPRPPRPYLSTAKDRGESSPRGHPPWQSPWGTPLLLGKRSRSARPCPTGARPHQAQRYPSRRQPPKVVPCRGSLLTTHKTSRGIPGFSIPPAGSLASRYHQYSSKYGAGTCPILVGTCLFSFSPELPRGGGKPHGTKRSLAGPTEEAHR